MLPAPAAVDTGAGQTRRCRSQTPPPRYPAAALRRGESGTVLVRVDVDTDGAPWRMSSWCSGSGSRDLDRAAMDAVRAGVSARRQRDGQPSPGTVNVPISFDRPEH